MMRAGRWLFVALVASSCVDRSSPPPSRSLTSSVPQTAAPPQANGSASPPILTAPGQPSTHTLRLLHRTLGGASPSDRLPWVVALHGLGDTPEGFAHLFDGLRVPAHVYLVQAPLPYGPGYDWFGERVSGDPEKLALAIQKRLAELDETLAELARQPRNRGGAVVTGFSQGGVLSFAVAVAGLTHVDVVLPLAGWLPPSLASHAPVLPTYAFHGETDRVVAFEATRDMVTRWRGARTPGPLTFTTYPHVGHSLDVQMRRDWETRLREVLREHQ